MKESNLDYFISVWCCQCHCNSNSLTFLCWDNYSYSMSKSVSLCTHLSWIWEAFGACQRVTINSMQLLLYMVHHLKRNSEANTGHIILRGIAKLILVIWCIFLAFTINLNMTWGRAEGDSNLVIEFQFLKFVSLSIFGRSSFADFVSVFSLNLESWYYEICLCTNKLKVI